MRQRRKTYFFVCVYVTHRTNFSLPLPETRVPTLLYIFCPTRLHMYIHSTQYIVHFQVKDTVPAYTVPFYYIIVTIILVRVSLPSRTTLFFSTRILHCAIFYVYSSSNITYRVFFSLFGLFFFFVVVVVSLVVEFSIFQSRNRPCRTPKSVPTTYLTNTRSYCTYITSLVPNKKNSYVTATTSHSSFVNKYLSGTCFP